MTATQPFTSSTFDSGAIEIVDRLQLVKVGHSRMVNLCKEQWAACKKDRK